MKKKLYKSSKKYQLGGNSCGDGLQWDASTMQCVPVPTDPNRVMPPKIDYTGDSTNFNSNSIVPLNSNQQTPQDLTYHPLFKLFNGLAQATTGIANEATNAGINKRQRLQTIQSFQNPNYSTANQDGLDKSPVMYKAGGKHYKVKDTDVDGDRMMDKDMDMMKVGGSIHIKPSHIGRFTTYKKRTGKTTAEALHSKDPKVRKMAQFASNAARWNHQTGGYVQPQTMKEWNSFLDFAKQKGVAGSPELDVRNKNLGQQTLNEYLQQNPNSTLTYDSIPKIQQELQTYRQQVLNDVKSNKRSFGEGVTESNFMSGLSKVDGWLGSKTSTYKFPEAYMNTTTQQGTQTKDLGLAATAAFQAGGEDDSPQDEKLDQEVAAMLQQGASPQEVVQKLIQSGVPQDKATQIVQEVMQQLQGGGGEQEQGEKQAGGDDASKQFYYDKETNSYFVHKNLFK